MSREQRFSTSMRGYTVSEVDTYVTRLTEQIAALEDERADLESELERARSELERARSELQEARDSLGDYRSAATRYVERVRALEALIAVGAREIAQRMGMESTAPVVQEHEESPDVEEDKSVPAEADADERASTEMAGESLYYDPREHPIDEPTNEEDAVG
jgi:DivIVA domain-containing protein